MPKLKVKKAWPNALNIPSPLSLEKSGLKRKFKPASAPSRVTDFIHKPIRITTNKGINILVYFSIPFFIPTITIAAVKTIKTSCKTTGLIGDSISFEKSDEISSFLRFFINLSIA